MDQKLASPSYRLRSFAKEQETPPPPPQEKNWMKVILIIIFTCITLLLAYYVLPLSRNQPQNKENINSSESAELKQSTNPAKLIGVKEGYLKLDDVLYQLTKTDDYESFGKRHELDITGDNVLVEIELNDTTFVLPKAYGTETNRNGTIITALVPIERLIQLAGDPRILAIRKPEK